MESKAMVSVDVLIPHFNDPDGLQLSLRSISKQDWHGKFRIVICDDGSSKGNLIQIEQLINNNKNIKLIKNRKNMGRPAARNILLNNIQSEYVTWLDAGDEWYPSKTRLQFEAIYHSKVRYHTDNIWVTCNYDWKWANRKPKKLIQDVTGDQVKSLMMGKNLRAYLWTILASADTFKKLGHFDHNLPRLQDLDYFIRFASQDGVIINTDSDIELCVYHKSDIGRNGEEVKNCFFYIYKKYNYLYHQHSSKFRKNRRYDIYMHTARFLRNNGDIQKKIKMYLKAFITHPLRFITSL